ncbi:Actin-related protein 10 [Schistosoma japonicum]|nr:Actin-related protein 10 [Schistosoma japonicum]
MPALESLMLGEKTAVVFDIGTVYTKCGFAGETGPRFIIPTAITLVCRIRIAPSVLFAASHLMALFTLGISSAIVLDCGYIDAQVLPVYEGYTLLNAWQSAQLGSKRIHENIKCYLKENAKLMDVVNGESHLSPCSDSFVSEHIIEDIKVRTCFISPRNRAIQWKAWVDSVDSSAPKPSLYQETFVFSLDKLGNSRPIQIPSDIRELTVECLFSGDNDQITITTLILQSIMLAPIDIRRKLAENIVLIGGTTMLPGAIFGALECLPGRSLNRSSFLENGFVPDWCTQIDQRHKDLERQDTTRQ